MNGEQTIEQRSGASTYRIATLLLLLMAAIFFLCRVLPPAPWIPWIQAFAEAAMVGALADWFAVTALFRHPLGLPIPHTAIIPTNQARIAETIGSFVQSNFLTPEVLLPRIRAFHVGRRLARWMQSEEHARRVATVVLDLVQRTMRTVDDTTVMRFIDRNVRSLLQERNLGSFAAHTLDLLFARERFHDLLNLILAQAEALLDQHQAFLRDKLRDDMPWWVPNIVHDHVYRTVLQRIRQRLHDVNTIPTHPLRARAEALFRELLQTLTSSPSFGTDVERLWVAISGDAIVRSYASRVWSELRRRLAEDLERPNSRVLAVVAERLGLLAAELQSDIAMQDRLEHALLEIVELLLQSYRGTASDIIASTVRRWDPHTLIDKIEAEVGRDLPYIRINGTLVGGLVGLLLHAISEHLAR